MKIHGIAYLLVGALVSAVSWYVGLSIFFYVGLVFLAFGVFRLLSGFILRGKNDAQFVAGKNPLPNCPRCRAPLNQFCNFCYNCGVRVR